MLRLGLRLSLKSGREAFVRLAVTAGGVAIGVAILLAVLADFHAFQVSSSRQCWECTQGAPLSGGALSGGALSGGALSGGALSGGAASAGTELWNYRDDYFRGRTVERLDVAALGPHAPVPPGIPRLPGPGQFYASPALASLLRTVPRDELGDRFPGTMIGTIGAKALAGPGSLTVFVGRPPRQLAALPGTLRVHAIAGGSGKQVWSPYFRYAFAVGTLAILFPILILIGTATRLAATRREERYAAFRLVGATPRQVSVVSSVDAIVSAVIGTLAGIGLFALFRPALAGAAIIGTRYFASDVTPTAADYLGMLIAVPATSAVASLLALRRVRISPLGVSRKVTPPPPRLRRMVPLLVGIALFVFGLIITNPQSIGAPVYPGLLVIMIGLVVGGPWLTGQSARLFAKFMTGASSLLAARRLSDNPKAAFRTVNGLVLAVFLGTVIAAITPAINATTATPSANALSNVLLDGFTYAPAGNSGTSPLDSPASPTKIQAEGLPPHTAARLLSQLRAFRGTAVIPLYTVPSNATTAGYRGVLDAVITCQGVRELGVVGRCGPGLTAVVANDSQLVYSDNPTYSTQSFVDRNNRAAPAGYTGFYLQAVLVKVNDPATLERVRTFLATHTPQSASAIPPITYGESVQTRVAYADTAQRMIYVAVALTLLVAGCSLAVAVGGGLAERKRPFTLLRVSGTALGTLYRVVLLEAVLPLVAATVVAAGTAYGISLLAIEKMAPPGTPIPGLGHDYYLTMGTGLATGLVIIALTMPLLGRITGPANVRFE